MRRPSPATVLSVAALVVAMSGTAVAATGGTFILGRPNSATTLTSLSNSKGTALKLSSRSGTPPLTVGSSVRVPNLNASELGGIPASGFMTGSGTAGGDAAKLSGTGEVVLATGSGSQLVGICDGNSVKGAYLIIQQAGGSAVWWNFNVVSSSSASTVQVTPESEQDFVVLAQTADGPGVSTYTATQTYDSGADTCSFTAQAVTTSH